MIDRFKKDSANLDYFVNLLLSYDPSLFSSFEFILFLDQKWEEGHKTATLAEALVATNKTTPTYFNAKSKRLFAQIEICLNDASLSAKDLLTFAKIYADHVPADRIKICQRLFKKIIEPVSYPRNAFQMEKYYENASFFYPYANRPFLMAQVEEWAQYFSETEKSQLLDSPEWQIFADWAKCKITQARSAPNEFSQENEYRWGQVFAEAREAWYLLKMMGALDTE